MTFDKPIRGVWMVVAALAVASAGCAEQVLPEDKAPLEAPVVVDQGSEHADWISYFTDVVGEFRYYGQTIETEFLPRGFVGLRFTGKGGEVVDVEAHALTPRRDTVLFLYPPVDPADPWGEIWRTPIAVNDDISWPEDTDSAILGVTLPRDGEYLVVVGEYRGRGGAFAATLRCAGGGCTNEPDPDPACVEAGGYCEYFLDGCREGYLGLPADAWGCPMGRSGICCLPEDVVE